MKKSIAAVLLTTILLAAAPAPIHRPPKPRVPTPVDGTWDMIVDDCHYARITLAKDGAVHWDADHLILPATWKYDAKTCTLTVRHERDGDECGSCLDEQWSIVLSVHLTGTLHREGCDDLEIAFRHPKPTD